MSLKQELIVIDFGSWRSRCGKIADDDPKTIVSNPESELSSKTLKLEDLKNLQSLYFEGENCMKIGKSLPNNFRPNNLVSFGRVRNLEKLYEYSFQEFGILNELSEKSVIISEQPMTPLKDQSETIELLFEKYGINNFFTRLQPQFSTFMAGKTNGSIVIDIGHEVSYFTPIVDSKMSVSSSFTSLFGGNVMTDYLQRILRDRGYEFEDGVDEFRETTIFKVMTDLKEQTGFVFEKCTHNCFWSSADRWADGKCEHEFELPDGSKMTIGSERFQITELMYRNLLKDKYNWFGKKESELIPIPERKRSEFIYYSEYGVGEDCFLHDKNYGILKIIENCIAKVSKTKNNALEREKLYQSIVLSGGTTFFPGFKTRLKKEFNYKYNPDFLDWWGHLKKKYRRNNRPLGTKKGKLNLEVEVQKNRYGSTNNWKSARLFSHVYDLKNIMVSSSEVEELGALNTTMRWFNHYCDFVDTSSVSLMDLEERIQFVKDEMFVLQDGGKDFNVFLVRVKIGGGMSQKHLGVPKLFL